jgi:cytoskeletal protein RodZ
MSNNHISQNLFNLENVEPRTYIVFAIVMIFTLGMISVLLAPEEEQFYETISTKEDVASDEVSTKENDASFPEEEKETEEKVEEKKKTPVKTPVKTPSKTTAGRKKTPAAKKDVMMSPVSRSGRTIKKPVLYEPGSPNGMWIVVCMSY